MAFAIGVITLLITIAMLQALVLFPASLVNFLHLPTWLAIALGGVLFSWLLGEPWEDRL